MKAVRDGLIPARDPATQFVKSSTQCLRVDAELGHGAGEHLEILDVDVRLIAQVFQGGRFVDGVLHEVERGPCREHRREPERDFLRHVAERRMGRCGALRFVGDLLDAWRDVLSHRAQFGRRLRRSGAHAGEFGLRQLGCPADRLNGCGRNRRLLDDLAALQAVRHLVDLRLDLRAAGLHRIERDFGLLNGVIERREIGGEAASDRHSVSRLFGGQDLDQDVIVIGVETTDVVDGPTTSACHMDVAGDFFSPAWAFFSAVRSAVMAAMCVWITA